MRAIIAPARRPRAGAVPLDPFGIRVLRLTGTLSLVSARVGWDAGAAGLDTRGYDHYFRHIT